MKRARLMVFGIALVAAAIAALLAKNFVGQPVEVQVVRETKADLVEVLVARSDVRLGDTLQTEDMVWQSWPRAAATSSYIIKRQNPSAKVDFAGAIARAPFLKGEPIKPQKLIKASDGGVLAAILPQGMRAVSTSISAETAAGLFILPNDRVDVILTRKIRAARGGRESFVSDTLFRNVRVMAIGQAIETDGDVKTANGDTATLELSPTQAELLALANTMGEISLSLRSLADSRPQSDADEAAALLRGDQRASVRVLKYGVASRAYGVK